MCIHLFHMHHTSAKSEEQYMMFLLSPINHGKCKIICPIYLHVFHSGTPPKCVTPLKTKKHVPLKIMMVWRWFINLFFSKKGIKRSQFSGDPPTHEVSKRSELWASPPPWWVGNFRFGPTKPKQQKAWNGLKKIWNFLTCNTYGKYGWWWVVLSSFYPVLYMKW